MALISPFISLSSSLPFTSMSSPSSLPIRLQSVSLGLHFTFGQSVQCQMPVVAQKRATVIAMASADLGEPASGARSDQSEDVEENLPVQNLPLESKLQLKLEQKMKMKIDKKIRLRRKRLMRKRRMRKRGNWPPSKMKKLKNV